ERVEGRDENSRGHGSSSEVRYPLCRELVAWLRFENISHDARGVGHGAERLLKRVNACWRTILPRITPIPIRGGRIWWRLGVGPDLPMDYRKKLRSFTSGRVQSRSPQVSGLGPDCRD